MNEVLERAKRGLQFEDIFQSSVNAWLADEYDPKFNTPEDGFAIQLKHQVMQSNLIEINEPDQVMNLFRIYTDVGVRIRHRGEAEDAEPVAQIEASYRLDYRILQPELKSDREALDAFALENSSYHLWPFWREYLMSQAVRMNLPKIPLPLRLVRQSRDGEFAPQSN